MKNKLVLIPDNLTEGLWCRGCWTTIHKNGKISGKDKNAGYITSKESKKKLIHFTRLALKDAQRAVVNLSTGLERLQNAPTKEW